MHFEGSRTLVEFVEGRPRMTPLYLLLGAAIGLALGCREPAAKVGSDEQRAVAPAAQSREQPVVQSDVQRGATPGHAALVPCW
ncbi:MAG: hypothetical protein JWN04_5561 [Myxococcaceae bacterium]|nr:hypothetical protein [Myxococcaceae bacterium]